VEVLLLANLQEAVKDQLSDIATDEEGHKIPFECMLPHIASQTPDCYSTVRQSVVGAVHLHHADERRMFLVVGCSKSSNDVSDLNT